MISADSARQFALSLPDVEEKEHFGMPSFRVRGKIFCTLWLKDNRAMVKLSVTDQSVFCSSAAAVFFPVPGGWGAKGATFVELKKVRKDMFKDTMRVAYATAAARTKAGRQE